MTLCVARVGVSIGAIMWSQMAWAQAETTPADQTQRPAAASQSTPAQDQAAEDVSGTNDIVVTASRDRRSLQDTPLSVNVATGEQLEKLNILDAKDIGRLVPGLELTNTIGRNNTITLRGIGFDPDQGTGPAIQTYLNEVPTNAQTLFTGLYDIGQIEVLRGAQGLLRGLSAPAGAITITTRRPDFDHISGYAQATATDRHAYNVQMGVSLPLSEKFAIRVAALVDGNRLNQVKNITNGDHSNSDTQSARITLGWRPTDDFTAYLTYQYLEQDNRQYLQVVGPGNAPAQVPFGDPTRSGPPLAVDDYAAVTDGPARFQNRTHTLNLNANWDLGGATLTVIGGYQSSLLDIYRDVDNANAIPGYQGLSSQTTPIYATTADVRLASKNEGMFGWSLGAFYQRQRGTTTLSAPADNFFGTFPSSLGLYLPITTHIRVPTKSDVFSFNANARVHVAQFTFEGGLRYTMEKGTREVDILAVSPGYPGAPALGIPPIPAFSFASAGIPADQRDVDNRPLTGGATLTWEPSPTLTVYASYGHSFRSGTAGIAAPAGLSTDLTVTRNEATDSFEIGAKGSLANHRVNFAIAGFYQKFDNFLTRVAGIYYNCPDFFGSCNASAPPINNATDVPPVQSISDFNYNGDATIKGVEASLDLRPTDFWDIGINAAYSKARFAKGAMLPCNDYNGDGHPDATGAPRISGSGNVSFCHFSRLTDTPDFSLTANTELRLPTSGPVVPFVRGLLSYRPSVYSERTLTELPSITRIDLFVGVRVDNGRWEISAFAKNLLDQKRVTNVTYLGNAIATTSNGFYDSGYHYISATSPRELGLTAAFHF